MPYIHVLLVFATDIITYCIIYSIIIYHFSNLFYFISISYLDNFILIILVCLFTCLFVYLFVCFLACVSLVSFDLKSCNCIITNCSQPYMWLFQVASTCVLISRMQMSFLSLFSTHVQ